MLLSEIFNKIEKPTLSHIPTHYTDSTTINNLTIDVDIDLIKDGNVAIVDFYVNGSQIMQKDTPLPVVLKIIQFVISCIKQYNDRYPQVEFCFGADAEHEKMYDVLLPRIAPKYNMVYGKNPVNMPKFEQYKQKILSMLNKDSVKISCLYYIKRDQSMNQ